MTIPPKAGFDPAVHLRREDIAVDDARAPTVLRMRLKQSKTDPFRKGIFLFIGKTSTELCPVMAMLSSGDQRGSPVHV